MLNTVKFREETAVKLMAAMIAATPINETYYFQSMAMDAIRGADALIQALNKAEGPTNTTTMSTDLK